jgi:predicted glycosyltransferase
VTVRPPLLFYCQHSRGLGHLVRSFALAGALAERFRVTLLCGGADPRAVRPPADVELVWLPPLGSAPTGALVSRDGRRSLERARQTRRRTLLDAYRSSRPRMLVLELFPFGRRKFADELLPLLDHARCAARPPLAVASVRDLLVGGRIDQQAHDEVASVLANQYLDAVLVHSDPRFARFEETFRPRVPLRVAVHHTGFVVREPRAPRHDRHGPARVVVSAGGGLVGGHLLRAAIGAHGLLARDLGLRTRVVAGPFLSEADWNALRRNAAGLAGLELRRSVPDLAAELCAASASVSQCGYNTVLDVLQAGVPALVVPFAEAGEDEQTERARRLERLGAVRVLAPGQLDGPTLAAAISELLHFRPRRLELDLDGARTSARLLAALEQSEAPVALEPAAALR